jgi:uncharacterized membrane protein YphA (DoxX/SURF4 family)
LLFLRKPAMFAALIAVALADPRLFLPQSNLPQARAPPASMPVSSMPAVETDAQPQVYYTLDDATRAQQPSMIASRGRRVPVPEEEETPEFLQELQELFILVLRLGTCSLMVHHGFDKIANVDGFSANVVAKFFGFLPGPPQFWTLSAAATQIAGAGLLGLGVLSRPVAASMSATMIVAVIFHLLNTGGEAFPLGVPKAHSYNFELAAMYVLVLGYFTVSGAGKYSVDEQVLGGEINIYKGLVAKVFGGGD